MLKSEFIKIPTKGCRKIPYFESLGYKVDVEYIEIKVKDLNSGSRIKVDVTCDYCDKDVKVEWKEYIRNISIGDKYSCSKFCGSLKAKESNLKKWGVENAMCLQVTQEKQKRTNIEKYGVEYLQQSGDIREKTKKSMLKKWGVDHISKSENFKKRSSIWTSSDEFRSKSKKTFLENWGVDNPLKSDIIQKKIKEKFSSFTDADKEMINQKHKKTLLERHGVDNIMKSEEFRKDNFMISNHDDYLEYLFNGISKFRCDRCHSDFEIKSDNFYKRFQSNLPLCTICHPINSGSISQSQLEDFIRTIHDGEIIKNYRDGLEIDIYLPDLGIGFEFNGLYWHSEEYKEKNYHSDKTNFFKKRGIRIIHIWEDDWIYKQNIIKSQIKSWLKKSDYKIYARKCEVREVIAVNESNLFLDNNHIQGKVRSTIKLGLYYNNELVSLMTFDHFEGRNRMSVEEWNLSRFCNLLETNVIGGASKLFIHFIKKYNPIRIISYADLDWSQGDLYHRLGFKLISESITGYKYVINGKRVHKSRFRKSRLNTDLSESSYMISNGIKKIWDCGKLKFEKTFSSSLQKI